MTFKITPSPLVVLMRERDRLSREVQVNEDGATRYRNAAIDAQKALTDTEQAIACVCEAFGMEVPE